MRQAAVYYHSCGYNCSQCILKAAENRFGIVVSPQCMNSLGAVCNGFGVQSMCSVLVAGMMVFGILFGDETAKRLRMKLLDRFHEKYNGINCGHIVRLRDNSNSCDDVIGDVAEMIEQIVLEEGYRG